MEMKRKLNASVLSIILLAVLVINGCAKDNNGGQTANESNSTAEPGASSAKPVEIK